MITKSLVAGIKPPELKTKVINMLSLTENWKDDPDVVFEVLRKAADAWTTVEMADETREKLRKRQGGGNNGNSAKARKPGSDENDASPSVQDRCWDYDEPGHNVEFVQILTSTKIRLIRGRTPVWGHHILLVGCHRLGSELRII